MRTIFDGTRSGCALALHRGMTNKNVNETIDDVADAAKLAAEKAGVALANATAKVGDAAKLAADKLEQASKKLGA
jgi:hypothetical protein